MAGSASVGGLTLARGWSKRPGPRPKPPGPLRFFLRVRGRRGHQIAAVAVARKLAVLCWHLLTRSRLPLGATGAGRQQVAINGAAGRPTGQERNIKELREREIELARHAELAYERFVGRSQRRGNAKQRTGAAKEERL